MKIAEDILKGILLISLIAAGVLFGYQKSLLKDAGVEREEVDIVESSENQVENETTKSISKEYEMAEIDISNWETYRNEEYGFEIQYPQGWDYVDRNTGKDPTPFSIKFSNDPNFVEVGGGSLGPGAYWDKYFSLVLYKTPQTVFEYIREQNHTKTTDFVLEGHSTLMTENQGDNYKLETYVKKGDYIYIFTTIVPKEENIPEMKAIFGEAVARFLFLDESKTSNLNEDTVTYKNTAFNFEIDAPRNFRYLGGQDEYMQWVTSDEDVMAGNHLSKGSKFIISTKENSEKLSVEEWLNEKKDDGVETLLEEESLQIGLLKGVKQIFAFPKDNASSTNTRIYMTGDNDLIIGFSTSYLDGRQELREAQLIDIINSFKFIE